MTISRTAETNPKLESIVNKLSAVDSDERRWAVYNLEEFEPSQIVDYLIQAIQDENRAVREAASEVLETLPPELCVEKLVPLLGSVRIEVRNIVAAILVRFGDDAIDGLLPALFHENEDVRKFAADILGLAGSNRAVPGLCKAALEDDVKNVVVSAVEALGKIGSREALSTLYTIFDRDKALKLETAEAIGLIGDHEAASFLEKNLNDDNYMVVYAVIDALGNIGNIESLKALKENMDNVPMALKEQVCRAILRIGRKRNVNVLNDGDADLSEMIIKCYDDQDDILTELVSYQLSLKPDYHVLKKFLENVDKLPPALIVALINAAKNDKRLVEMICDLTDHEDDWVAYTALESLVNFDKQRVKDTVLKMLYEERGLPVIAAIKTSVQLKLTEAKPLLENLSNCENEDIRGAAIQAINEL